MTKRSAAKPRKRPKAPLSRPTKSRGVKAADGSLIPTLLKKRPEEKLDPNAVLDVIVKVRGNVAAAARALNVERETICNYMRRYPEIADARERTREARIDLAESALDHAVLKGEGWAVCFFLKTQGRSRGYSEGQGQAILNIDLSTCTTEQLQRIASGEDALQVLASTSSGR